MGIQLQQMSLSAYADLQTRLGVKIIQQDGRYWRQIRPFFYRPLLPVEDCAMSGLPPPLSWPSGYQYVVPTGQPANSTMNFLMLDDLPSYSLDRLGRKRRYLIKRAALQCTVRQIVDPAELKLQGHRVYLSFYERTRYPYKSERRNKRLFDHWVDDLFSTPATIVLGGYGATGLAAFSTAFWIGQTLVHSTMVCDDEALDINLGELLFHEIRQLAATETGIKRIFVRSYQGGNSLDRYYLLRGCRLERKPARLEMPTPLHVLIRFVLPKKYHILCGDD